MHRTPRPRLGYMGCVMGAGAVIRDVRQQSDLHMTDAFQRGATEQMGETQISVTSVPFGLPASRLGVFAVYFFTAKARRREEDSSPWRLFVGLRDARGSAVDRRIAGSSSAGSNVMGRGAFLDNREHSAKS
jgi:hypothetical protein